MARSEARWSVGRILRRRASRRRVQELYESRHYLDAYSEHTDLRVEEDFRAAVGGSWEQMGKLQFDFLVQNGLQPHHRMLDIGCGTLRGGRHFIRYLDAGNYTGMDISAKAIEVARRLVEDEGLSEKRVRLLVSTRKDLRFAEFDPESFDELLAHSVFTHLKTEHIEECFRHVGRVMRPGASFFFTYYDGPRSHQRGRKTFEHPLSFFESLAELCGFELVDCADDFAHPSAQRMVMLRHRTAGR